MLAALCVERHASVAAPLADAAAAAAAAADFITPRRRCILPMLMLSPIFAAYFSRCRRLRADIRFSRQLSPIRYAMPLPRH